MISKLVVKSDSLLLENEYFAVELALSCLCPVAQACTRQGFCPGVAGSGLYDIKVFAVLFKGVCSWFCSPAALSCLGRRGLMCVFF